MPASCVDLDSELILRWKSSGYLLLRRSLDFLRFSEALYGLKRILQVLSLVRWLCNFVICSFREGWQLTSAWIHNGGVVSKFSTCILKLFLMPLNWITLEFNLTTADDAKGQVTNFSQPPFKTAWGGIDFSLFIIPLSGTHYRKLYTTINE